MATSTFTETTLPTRTQYEELRIKYRDQLIRSISPTELLLSALSAIDTYTDKVSEIRAMETPTEMSDKILSLLVDENYPNTIGPFLSALSNNGHAHVADVFMTGSNDDLLTDENYQLFSDKLADLCTYLDPECGIVDSLISAGVFSRCDEERITAQKTTNDKARQITKILSRKSNSSYKRFINVLREKNEELEHILYILTREGTPPISAEDLNLIKCERVRIIHNMESMHTSLISRLVSLHVFTDVDRQRVEAVNVHYKRNEEILNILTRKSSRHLHNFIEALKKTEQNHVADRFDCPTINGRVHTIVRHDSSATQESAESSLRPVLKRDLEDDESAASKNLHNLGIHKGGVDDGSILIWFKVSSRETLKMLRSDELDTLFTEMYHALLADKGVESIHIEILEEEFKRCEQIIGERQALMTPEHQYTLELAKEKIPDKIFVDEDLLKSLTLCQYRQDAILSQSSSEDKAKVLLDVMARRPDCEFQQLLNVLRTTQQKIAADFIDGKNFTDSSRDTYN